MISSNDQTKLLRYIQNEKIKIFKYTLKQAREPKNKQETKMFNVLKHHSRARSFITINLYWNAYNFFQQYNYNLISAHDGTFMNIAKEIAVPDVCSNFIHPTVEGEPNTIVRCGEIEGYKVLQLAKCKIKYLWLFPFAYYKEDQEDDVLNCYLFEINDQLKKELDREFLELQKRILQKTY